MLWLPASLEIKTALLAPAILDLDLDQPYLQLITQPHPRPMLRTLETLLRRACLGSHCPFFLPARRLCPIEACSKLAEQPLTSCQVLSPCSACLRALQADTVAGCQPAWGPAPASPPLSLSVTFPEPSLCLPTHPTGLRASGQT